MDIAPARMLQRGLIEVYWEVVVAMLVKGWALHQNIRMHLIVNIVTSHDTGGCHIVTL